MKLATDHPECYLGPALLAYQSMKVGQMAQALQLWELARLTAKNNPQCTAVLSELGVALPKELDIPQLPPHALIEPLDRKKSGTVWTITDYMFMRYPRKFGDDIGKMSSEARTEFPGEIQSTGIFISSTLSLYICVYLFVYIYIYIYIYMCVCVCVCMCVYVSVSIGTDEMLVARRLCNSDECRCGE